ncbi:hypothetical protein I3F60_01925 [Streptomyces sp. MUM 136J]|uniref:hypothetical protein n=1 Tax=Streptomyces sp. MUM 136J TaxID=2791992 RepID=UPI001F046066|nr:hypothetical protein [Streptomyces sp. MUM 136J]MCH0568035.1 hypothetical protein [Streptomyces sp. MUM 136J]
MTFEDHDPSAPRTNDAWADALAHAVQLALATLRSAPSEAEAWDATAGSLEWTCWETAEHLADDLFFYGMQIGTPGLPPGTYVPLEMRRQRPEGPVNILQAEREPGPSGLLTVLEACGAMQVSLTRTTPPSARAHHAMGASDPAGFAAMGIVETLLHTFDIAAGFGMEFTAPDDLCALVLDRLFPHVERGEEPWPTLLWATGRGELAGRERLEKWRWYGEVRGAE